MSAEAWIALAGLILVGLGLITGAAWWMSALYSRVGHIQHNTKSTNIKIDTLTETMDTKHNELRRDVTDLQVRMVRVEDAVDTERE